ncbi:hypothetical protein BN59_01913 [Legionella massiliensis]|uniref:Uncharacterized protein n=1 Tax=Legionella massiliensis TaxID=1034943 RepID=A0A078L0Q5_9GAMM|nr:hypothetical protein [Legionella massiliensis]CDZ77629.1 hypothetical protein BN59_01913 [Legionella massiliensis]CEE13367.1 hypothetical protein BN1094_01913 [Legionella massiliensis]
MTTKTEEFLAKCAENKKNLEAGETYSSPSITALDLDELIDTRGGSATSVTTTGAAVAASTSALF